MVNEASWHLTEGNFTETALDATHCKVLENYTFENTATSSQRLAS